jgi:hypothetical protein
MKRQNKMSLSGNFRAEESRATLMVQEQGYLRVLAAFITCHRYLRPVELHHDRMVEDNAAQAAAE